MRQSNTVTPLRFFAVLILFCHWFVYPAVALPQVDSSFVLRTGLGRMMMGDYAGALDSFKGLQTADPGNPVLNYHVGVCRLNLGEYPGSIKNLTLAAKEESLFVRARYARGRALAANGQRVEAVNDFLEVLRADSSFRPARLELLRIFSSQGDTAKVARWQSDPPNLAESLVLGRGWLVKGNLSEALRHATRASSLAPHDYNTRLLLGDVLFAREAFDDALGLFGMLLMEHPSSPMLARKCALCYERMPSRHLRTAVMMMQRTMRLAGDTTVGDAGKIGNWLYELRQYDSAEVFFRRLVQTDSTVAEGQFNLGLTLLQQGEMDEALMRIGRAEQLVQGDMRFLASIQKNLGVVHIKRKEFESALTRLERALQLDPGYLDAIHSTALCYDEMGNHADALDWYRRFLSSAADRIAESPVLESAKKRVEILSSTIHRK